ncbi:40S ribosomal protein S12 [Trifolium medium]|uniref:40S ribosomal protein S12 n=1 Tax=Trifolium medium TaxID=97028 RepID=A0A392M5C1_9FABA|nr:40S ribosomal protein S12 [Trifolium medium]
MRGCTIDFVSLLCCCAKVFLRHRSTLLITLVNVPLFVLLFCLLLFTPYTRYGGPGLVGGAMLISKKSQDYGGLTRGLHESAKVIEKNAAQLCVQAEDCDQPDYVKLVKALCAEHNVGLLTVPNAKTLR